MKNSPLEKFASDLCSMAHSPTKADRDAVNRVELKTGMSVGDLLHETHDLQYFLPEEKGRTEVDSQTINPTKATKINPICAGAIVGGGIAAIVMLAANPQETLAASIIGAGTGAIVSQMKKDE